MFRKYAVKTSSTWASTRIFFKMTGAFRSARISGVAFLHKKRFHYRFALSRDEYTKIVNSCSRLRRIYCPENVLHRKSVSTLTSIWSFLGRTKYKQKNNLHFTSSRQSCVSASSLSYDHQVGNGDKSTRCNNHAMKCHAQPPLFLCTMLCEYVLKVHIIYLMYQIIVGTLTLCTTKGVHAPMDGSW